MFRRGRAHASVSLLIAGCLGVAMFAAGQLPAAAAQPLTAPSASVHSGSTPATGGKPAATSSTTGKQASVPQRLAADQPDYAPAGCNAPDLKKGEARCFAMVQTNSAHRIAAAVEGPAPTALGPADIQAAYHLPAAGQGQTVAIVDAFGDSAAASDLAVFRSHYGLPACTAANGCFQQVGQDGGTTLPADDAGWAEETSLDLDAVSSACPNCRILLVESDSDLIGDLSAATNTAVGLGAKYVSNSYGLSGEDPTETSLTAYEHPGVAITASTGDIGNVVNWPAADPDVIAVGGTTLTQDPGSARGWDEAAWSGGGSGCSQFEPQPAYQAAVATGCARRATSDISADADPNSGLAVYDTLGQPGWLQVGGTSLSSPLVASMYALAGTPTPGAYPVAALYANQGNHLFDVTKGSDGGCGTVLCTAGAGWDGPTGLGTPNGVTGLTLGPQGTAAGQVTAGGTPVPGVGVTLTDQPDGLVFHATTDAQGHYSAPVGIGTYQVTATAYGYLPATASAVRITEGTTTTVNLAVTKVPTRTLSGKVTDGSGHGWPLYAKITVDGYPGGALYTDPKTGAYSVDLPQQNSYTLHVTPLYPGYLTQDLTAALGTRDLKQNIPVGVDEVGCTAPGYGYPAQADFENWTGTASQHGWTVTDKGTSGHAWEFDDPNQQWNLTGGTGNFAAADPYDLNGAAEDTYLTSPVMDLTHQATADLKFDAAYLAAPGASAQVDLSLDGGGTWAPVWQQSTADFVGAVDLPLIQAVGHSGVQVRFHYTGSGVTLMELDNVTVASCSTVSGALVQGVVTDANTHQPINGATVTDTSAPETVVSTAATPQDANLSDGFYWLFSGSAGHHTYRTAANRYTSFTGKVTTAPSGVVRNNVTLQAGQLRATPGKVSLAATQGHRATQDITLTNTGREPLHVTLGEQSSGFTPAAGSVADPSTGAPLHLVKGNYPTGPAHPADKGATTPTAPTAPALAPAAGNAPGTAPWQRIANYPEPIMDNAAGYYQGKVYSVGGVHQIVGGQALADGFVYDPATAAWSPIAPLPQPLESPTAAFLNGTLYVAGGWNLQGVEQSTLYAYHPATNTWSRLADLPQATASAGSAVLDGSLYVIGGCSSGCAGLSAAVYRYSPAGDSWTRLADYPTTVQWNACAGIDSAVVCAGGASKDPDGHTLGLTSTYLYHPGSGTWAKAADMPYQDWGMTSTGANGELQVVGGVSGSNGTNQAEQYDPLDNVWTTLPNAAGATFRGGSSGCGMYQVGGAPAGGFFPVGSQGVQVLPGFDQCGGDSVSWLSESKTSIDLAPGHSVQVRVTADVPTALTPGTYAATLSLVTDTPYVNPPVTVNLRVSRR